jgi:hypothetical protein
VLPGKAGASSLSSDNSGGLQAAREAGGLSPGPRTFHQRAKLTLPLSKSHSTSFMDILFRGEKTARGGGGRERRVWVRGGAHPTWYRDFHISCLFLQFLFELDMRKEVLKCEIRLL